MEVMVCVCGGCGGRVPMVSGEGAEIWRVWVLLFGLGDALVLQDALGSS